jgi:hypothetical protein
VPFSFAFTRLNALQAAVRHPHSLSDPDFNESLEILRIPVLRLVTQANNPNKLFEAMKRKRLNAMPAPLKFLVLLAGFHSGSYAHAFTSLSPVAENQVWVNHLIQFQQSMSNPTNEPSREPICEPTNDRKKSEPIVSYSQIKRVKSTSTFQLIVAFVSNNNALSFNDKPSSKFELVVASVANGFSKGLSKKTTQC